MVTQTVKIHVSNNDQYKLAPPSSRTELNSAIVAMDLVVDKAWAQKVVGQLWAYLFDVAI